MEKIYACHILAISKTGLVEVRPVAVLANSKDAALGKLVTVALREYPLEGDSFSLYYDAVEVDANMYHKAADGYK